MRTEGRKAGREAWPVQLRVEYAEGNVAHLNVPFTTGWRRMPLHAFGHLTSGSLVLVFEGERRVVIREGQGFYLAAGSLHRVDKRGSAPLVSRWAHFSVSQAGQGDPLLRLDIPSRLDGPTVARAGELCKSMAALGPTELPVAAAAVKLSMLYELVSILARFGEVKEESAGATDAIESHAMTDPDLTRLRPAIDMMRQFHFQPLEIERLAALAHLSVPRFRAVFRRVTGLPPHRYIQRLRFELAKRLLERGDEPVKIVAQRVGYENPYLFGRLFKKDVGMTPLEHRKRSRNLSVA